jgi:hypothetical protein
MRKKKGAATLAAPFFIAGYYRWLFIAGAQPIV